jgi:RepB DNA-primase from phage plasmid
LFARIDGGSIRVQQLHLDPSAEVKRPPKQTFASSVTRALKTAKEADSQGRDAFFGVCKMEANTLGSQLGAGALWADIDAVKNGWQVADCVAALTKLAPALRPSAIVASGAGLHLYWFLNEPITDHAAIVTANKTLAKAFGGDMGATDVARILRVPGTRNFKHAGQPRVELLVHTPKRFDAGKLLSAAQKRGRVFDAEAFPAPVVATATAPAERAASTSGGFPYGYIECHAIRLATYWDCDVRCGGIGGKDGCDRGILRTASFLANVTVQGIPRYRDDHIVEAILEQLEKRMATDGAVFVENAERTKFVEKLRRARVWAKSPRR